MHVPRVLNDVIFISSTIKMKLLIAGLQSGHQPLTSMQ